VRRRFGDLPDIRRVDRAILLLPDVEVGRVDRAIAIGVALGKFRI
jgi:hypothetical protein